ncbi:DRTGG domain-containing protein [Tepidanaerobacter sp. EBM-38]|jgi:predicted transcriptional regulator|uniref:DRTGG domain-containing protein n=1 Tax=Tepidanaerobacter sp. EBM-38 TaxID=1918496 RepID=UPI000A74447E|nr:DRTGG domain-containing protein [Tepidanaerobacter sp. EBM-38]
MTKHARIIEYIKKLEVGSKISVRQLANDLNVSEGTAYRAIKDAQLAGYVCTMPRIGTIRIEKKTDEAIEHLSFAEVVNIVEGSVMGGKSGLHKPLSKFLIGAMEVEEMHKFIEPESLLIVGNRKDAQILALKHGAAVLVTGGFDVDDEVIKLADDMGMPLLSSSYDTFTVATIINSAIYKRLVRKEVVRVKDAMVKEPDYLTIDATVGDWRNMYKKTQHSKFPVVDKDMKVCGIVTTNDISSLRDDVLIKDVMSKDPIVLTKDTPVAHAARLMGWEGIKLIPVVEDKRLVGILTRKDAIKALQHLSFQPQIGETADSIVMSRFSMSKTEDGVKLQGKTDPVMLNPYGVASSGALMTVIANAGFEAFRAQKRLETVLDSFTVYFSKPVQLEQEIEIEAKIIDIGRKSGKAEINLMHEEKLVAKAIISVRVIDR